ncbi:NUDIX domain-containing protein [Acidiluteibacter ferrifornacis]|uniref:NUDIX domain-containing protein n=1 Tax=Acidiluteibacter ferrifornacis TaxID=2692424 RepID=A0A6N9NI76_9FLAO|nr:NUDIX hydrolase [Acidiluteibacter ferrifornacis]NBG65534.1 NUDIX domain-containing protein [Acidiluteibacter ferrifornacis]
MDQKSGISRFNVRIYGVLFSNDRQRVLVSDEFRFGRAFTKFPGGGLEFGEGVLDALKREFYEEMEIDVLKASLFYINENFQDSAFSKKEQLLSIYYLIEEYSGRLPMIAQERFDFDQVEEAQSFRWIEISKMSEEEFTFPVDKVISNKLKLL